MSSYAPKSIRGGPVPWRQRRRRQNLAEFIARMLDFQHTDHSGCAKCDGVMVGLRVPKRHHRTCDMRGYKEPKRGEEGVVPQAT